MADNKTFLDGSINMLAIPGAKLQKSQKTGKLGLVIPNIEDIPSIYCSESNRNGEPVCYLDIAVFALREPSERGDDHLIRLNLSQTKLKTLGLDGKENEEQRRATLKILGNLKTVSYGGTRRDAPAAVAPGALPAELAPEEDLPEYADF